MVERYGLFKKNGVWIIVRPNGVVMLGSFPSRGAAIQWFVNNNIPAEYRPADIYE